MQPGLQAQGQHRQWITGGPLGGGMGGGWGRGAGVGGFGQGLGQGLGFRFGPRTLEVDTSPVDASAYDKSATEATDAVSSSMKVCAALWERRGLCVRLIASQLLMHPHRSDAAPGS